MDFEFAGGCDLFSDDYEFPRHALERVDREIPYWLVSQNL